MLPHIHPAARKKVQFDVENEKETFFDTRDILNKHAGKLHIYEMPPTLDLTMMLGPSWKANTLQKKWKVVCF